VKDTLRQITNLVTVIIALTVNVLASTLPLNGQNTGEISDRFEVYFVPAGYVFAIWFFIFTGWIIFSIYQFLPSQKENLRLRRLGYLFAISNIVNAVWLFMWHYNFFGVSVLVMLSLLGLLIASYVRLDVNRVPVTRTERWSVDIPFSVYLGWITVATVANITSWLYSIDWNGCSRLGCHHDRGRIHCGAFDDSRTQGRCLFVRTGLVLYRYRHQTSRYRFGRQYRMDWGRRYVYPCLVQLDQTPDCIGGNLYESKKDIPIHSIRSSIINHPKRGIRS